MLVEVTSLSDRVDSNLITCVRLWLSRVSGEVLLAKTVGRASRKFRSATAMTTLTQYQRQQAPDSVLALSAGHPSEIVQFSTSIRRNNR